MENFIQVCRRKSPYNKVLINVNDIIRVEEVGYYATIVVKSYDGKGIERIDAYESYSTIVDKLSEIQIEL